jgi:hypothetical protein
MAASMLPGCGPWRKPVDGTRCANTCRSATPRVGRRRRIATNALVVVALGVEFLRLAQILLRQARMLPAEGLQKGRPIPLILPA